MDRQPPPAADQPHLKPLVNEQPPEGLRPPAASRYHEHQQRQDAAICSTRPPICPGSRQRPRPVWCRERSRCRFIATLIEPVKRAGVAVTLPAQDTVGKRDHDYVKGWLEDGFARPGDPPTPEPGSIGPKAYGGDDV